MTIEANNPLDGTGDSGSIDAATSAFEAILSGKTGDREDPETQDDAPQGESQDDTTDDEPQGESEDESQEESDDDESQDDSDDEQDDDQQQQTFTVKIDGQEVDVSLTELQSGYMRNADYTRKSQANAAARKEIESRAQSLFQEHQQYAQILPLLKQQIERDMPQEPNWVELKQADPEGYLAARADWDFKLRQRADVESEMQRMDAVTREQREREIGQHLEQEGERLVSAIPAWSDQKVAATERKGILEYAQKTLGYDAEELSQIYDHRAVVTLRKAMLFDQMMGKRAQVKPVQQATAPTLKPGASRTVRAPTTDLTRAKQRLAKTGTVRDAQAVFERMLSR